jgi:LuxR family maltose regulon positive regulatory protein
MLRTTPPKAPRHQLLRSRLGLDDENLRDRSVLLVEAPPGFGKTSLLGQWRREFLARGAAVAWLSADDHSDARHFLQALTLAVRVGCGRPTFGRYLIEGGDALLGELEGITTWLSEVGQTALDIVLIVDEAERLAENNLSALVYLLHNLPPNLRVVIGGRNRLDAALADLMAYGSCVLVGPEMLRFRLDETIDFVRGRFGPGVDADACARLHELAEGWPLGLQLVLASVEGGGDPRAAINLTLARNDWRGVELVGGLLDQLDAGDVDFLMRVSVVEGIHPDLCASLTGNADAPAQLARLVRDTPIFVIGDDGEWCRLHALIRDALRLRLEALPEAERLELHARAMRWLAKRGMTREAARHARAAGQRRMALDLAEQSLYDAVTQGLQGAVLEWLEGISEAELEHRPRLRLAAAWALALSERQEEAGRLVGRILEAPDVDAGLRYECALILSGAAYFADDPDRCREIFAPWRDSPPLKEPRLAQMHGNRMAILAILDGDPPQARRYLQQVPRSNVGKAQAYSAGWVDFIVGLSYLWEGQVLLGEEVLRPALMRTETELGRRHPVACMLGALMAASLYERDRVDESAAVLANRLDVLERVGSPETTLLGYRTAARIAAAQGIEHRALDLLEALGAIGVARNLPRLCVASLAEQVRLHAGKFRSETCRVLAARIDEIMAGEHHPTGPLWRHSASLLQSLSHVNVAIAAQDWEGALARLDSASALVDTLKLGRLRLEIMALRALALDRKGADGRSLMLEAINLAQTFGLARTFVDAHPIIADWVRRLADEEGGGESSGAIPVPRAVRPRPFGSASVPRAVPSMVLTPKEREVLEFLARNLSNKEIATAMSVGEETVKWHLKNLFGKLEAGSRKHVVRRAQLLGLLEGGD